MTSVAFHIPISCSDAAASDDAHPSSQYTTMRGRTYQQWLTCLHIVGRIGVPAYSFDGKGSMYSHGASTLGSGENVDKKGGYGICRIGRAGVFLELRR